MIAVQPLNTLDDYEKMGFDRHMNRVEDSSYSGVRKKSFVSSLAFDAQFEGVDVNKLTSNQLRQQIKMGNMTIDGKNNRITVGDGRKDTVLIGYKRNSF